MRDANIGSSDQIANNVVPCRNINITKGLKQSNVHTYMADDVKEEGVEEVSEESVEGEASDDSEESSDE